MPKCVSGENERSTQLSYKKTGFIILTSTTTVFFNLTYSIVLY